MIPDVKLKISLQELSLRGARIIAQQASLIEQYSNEKNLWITDLPREDRYLARGGEARVYLHMSRKDA
jgi:Serine/Threonine/Tyrosine Kinase found in polyvalent proteins